MSWLDRLCNKLEEEAKRQGIDGKNALAPMAATMIMIGTFAFAFHVFKPLLLKWVYSDGRAERIAHNTCAQVPRCERAVIDFKYSPEYAGWKPVMTILPKKPGKGSHQPDPHPDDLRQSASQALSDAISKEDSWVFRKVFSGVELKIGGQGEKQ